MPILFVGSTPDDLGGATQDQLATLGRDPDFTPVGSNVLADPDQSGALFTVPFDQAASDTTWIHFMHATNQNQGYNNFADGYWMRFMHDGTEVGRVDLKDDEYYLEGGGQSIQVFKPSGSINYHFDFKVVQTGTNITIEMYVNGALEASVTGANTSPKINRVTFDHFDMVWNTSSRNWSYSEFIVTDNESTLGWRLSSHDPAADGFHTDWNGGFANLTDGLDGNIIDTDTADERQSWTLTPYNGGATSIRAIVNKISANAGAGSGPVNLAPFVRVAGVDYDQPAYGPNGTSEDVVIENNPATGTAWVTGDLATLEVGVKSET